MKNKIILSILVASIAIMSCSRVDPGYVGVKVKTLGQNKGVDPVELSVGRWWMGLLFELYTYPTYTVIYPFTAGEDEGSPIPEAMVFQDKGGIVCDVDVALSAHVDPTKATTVFQTYLNEMEYVIKHYCRQDMNNYFVEYSSKLSVDQIYSEEKMNMLNFVKNKMIEKYAPTGIIIEDIAYKGQIRFPKEVEDAIKAKIGATQIALQKEQEVMQAEADAKKRIAAAEGEAQSILKVAKAQAEANRILSASITPTLVNYKLVERWNGASPQYSGTGLFPPMFK